MSSHQSYTKFGTDEARLKTEARVKYPFYILYIFVCLYDSFILIMWNPIFQQRNNLIFLIRWTTGTGGWDAGHELEICTCSPKNQPYPWLYEKKCDKMVKGGDSVPLLWPHLCVALGSLAQEQVHRKALKVIKRVEHLFYEDRLTVSESYSLDKSSEQLGRSPAGLGWKQDRECFRSLLVQFISFQDIEQSLLPIYFGDICSIDARFCSHLQWAWCA